MNRTCTLIVLMPLLAGCLTAEEASTEPTTHVTPLVSETATYSVRDPFGPLGMLTVEAQGTDWNIAFQGNASRDTFPDMSFQARLASDGSVRSASSEKGTWFPAGAEAWMATSSLEMTPFANAEFPWRVLVPSPLPLAETHATADGAVWREGSGWIAQTPCRRDCDLALPEGHVLRTEAHYAGTGLLAQRVNVSVEGEPRWLLLERTQHEGSEPTPLPPPDPKPPTLPTAPACRDIACEPDGTSPQHSLQAVLDAVERSPQWITWHRDHPEARLIGGVVGYGRMEALDTEIPIGQTGSTVTFLDPSGVAATFTTRGTAEPGIPSEHVALAFGEVEDTGLESMDTDWDLPLAAWDAVLARAADAVDRNPEDASAAFLLRKGENSHPSPDHRITAALRFPDGVLVEVSVATGYVLSIRT